jgi:agmatine deiminase
MLLAGYGHLKFLLGAIMSVSPAADGFFMPAEWHPHSRTWMAWPCRADTWARSDGTIAEGQAAVVAIAQAIARFEPVTMICRPSDVADVSVRCGPGVQVLPLMIDDSWTRDSGASFLIDGKGGLAAVNWRFNGWGGLIDTYADDDRVAGVMAERAGARQFDIDLVMEGGAIHVDGEGTVLTTEQCLLDPNRNPGKSRDQIEKILCDALGAQKVIWLPRGYEDDETNGHVDEIACFARPGVVLLNMTDNQKDANCRIGQELADLLRASTDAKGRRIEVVPLPQPAPRYEGGRRLTLSYANFYMVNGGLIIPAFDDPADRVIVGLMQELFPDSTILQIPALAIARGGGCIHCITQQQPVP